MVKDIEFETNEISLLINVTIMAYSKLSMV